MNKETSIKLSAAIGAYIASSAPTVEYTDGDIKKAYSSFTPEDLSEMKELGLLGDDFELFCVIRKFLSGISLGGSADGEYIVGLFRNAKKLSADEFLRDRYISDIHIPDVRIGNVFLTTAEYARGEIFCYDMPDFTGEAVYPKLGFFTRPVRFPAIYENNLPWVSVCPSEVNSMLPMIKAAHGKILVLGLGLGYYTYITSLSDKVEKITVVELNKKIIDIFEKHILPQFSNSGKIRIIHADAIAYLDSVEDGDYDFCFADIWEGAVDGAPLYRKIKAHESRLPSTEFTYWIEDQIKAYIGK
ncbi:MAG: hypothetical protein IJT91_08040 [Clostridia bacterium]|nr:hypothetical protein [Clostridia bacterium]